LLAAVLGFVAPHAGTIDGPEDVAWSGQRPGLLQGSVAANVALGDIEPDAALVRRALAAAALPDLDPDTLLGASGSGLSGGQAQRVGFARALYRAWRRDSDVLVLDEPTSALDTRSEALLCRAMRAEAADGRGVLVVSHRPGVLAAADRVVELTAARAGASA
jgi:ATP-binding cassette subfamily C protein CydD